MLLEADVKSVTPGRTAAGGPATVQLLQTRVSSGISLCTLTYLTRFWLLQMSRTGSRTVMISTQ